MKKINKKTILFAAAGLLVLIGLVVGVCVPANRKPKLIPLEKAGLDGKSDIMLAADHGLCALAPENSTAAFAFAGEYGYAGVRFEVRRTVDGIWVVMEEDDVRGATDGKGKISEMTFKQVLRCRLDKGRGARRYDGDPPIVPTLEQALAVCSQNDLTPVIEVRQSGADCVEEVLRQVGGRQKKACVLIFAEEEQISKAKELLANPAFTFKVESVLLCRYAEKLSDKALAEAKKTPDVAVCFSAADNKIKAVKRFADEGLTLFALKVNKPKLAKALYDAGVRRFTTDKLVYEPILSEEEKTTEKPHVTRPSTTAKPTEKPSATAQ
ncbi:MAG: hypothetical protein IJU96_10245 [Clostridia bacterium]|nr:hypothetical protein [Clostridia bacterium]